MSRKFSSALYSFAWLCAWLLAAAPVLAAQTPARAPIVFATPPKLLTARLARGDNPKEFPRVEGYVSFIILSVNADETLMGTAVFTFSAAGRAQVAQLINRPLAETPANLQRQKVVANFRKGTACPRFHLELGALTFALLGDQLDAGKVTVELNETPEQLPQLFCLWTRQRNAGRQRGGVIAAINRLLTGEQP